MTDSQAPIEDRDTNIAELVAQRVIDAHDNLFERLYGLKTRGINDDDVIRALRHNGDETLATEYIEWAGAIDPDVDPTPEEGGVTDPGDTPSNKEMDKQYELRALAQRTEGVLRLCIDADCPGCGFPERFLVREVLPDGSPGVAVFGCNKCTYVSQERDA